MVYNFSVILKMIIFAKQNFQSETASITFTKKGNPRIWKCKRR